MHEPARISVIIPTLNEASTIDRTLRRVHQQAEPFEIIVVDGGSEDETQALARSKGATVRQAPQGRATQMNRGAEDATGSIFLFLHADTLLPPHGLSTIRSALDDPDTASGTFRLRFDNPTPLLRFYAWCTRWPWTRLCFGDRAQFAKRSAFEAVNGFPEWPIFEDLEFAARLDDHGGFRFLDSAVTTSARRFRRHGPLQQQLRNLYLWSHYMWGADPKRVAHLYHAPAPDTERHSQS
ncbi:MAG: TIGR04283 family arsenosugar biosynthesis glycosyltransferase [Salinibacter sp.]